MAGLLLLGALLGGLLGAPPRIWGGPGGVLGLPGGSETPPELEEEVAIVQRQDPHPPHCFSRTLHDLRCFWDSPGPAEPSRFRLQFRLELDPWQDCPLSATALPRGSRFWCSLPPAATVTFVPLELRVLPGTPATTGTPTETTGTPTETTGTPGTPTGTTGTPETLPGTTGTPTGTTGTTGTPTETPETSPGATGTLPGTPETFGTPTGIPVTSPGATGTTPGTPGATGPPSNTSETPGTPPQRTEPPRPLFQRILYIDQVVLPGPPQNVSVSAGGSRGELCVRWAPPPGPYLHSSLIFQLALSPPEGPPKTVGVPAGRREQGVGGLRASTAYSVRARARPDGISYGGFWSPWSPPRTATTPPVPPPGCPLSPRAGRGDAGTGEPAGAAAAGTGSTGTAGTPPDPPGQAVAAGAGPGARVRGALQRLRRQLPAVAVPGPGLPLGSPRAPPLGGRGRRGGGGGGAGGAAPPPPRG